MIDCLIIGDSVAVGVSQVRKECVSHANSGWSSQRWNQTYLDRAGKIPVQTVVISLGANDHQGIDTEAELRRTRSALQGKRVFWIDMGLNRRHRAQAAVEKIAKDYGDTVLARPQHQISKDGVHPTTQGYQTLARSTQQQEQ
jgi:hypothetical protein